MKTKQDTSKAGDPAIEAALAAADLASSEAAKQAAAKQQPEDKSKQQPKEGDGEKPKSMSDAIRKAAGIADDPEKKIQPEPDDEPPRNALSSEAKEKWKRLSQERKEAQAALKAKEDELKALSDKLKELEARQAPGDIKEHPEHKSLLSEKQKLEETVARLDFRESAMFKSKYLEPAQAAAKKIESWLSYIKEDGKRADALAAINRAASEVPFGEEHDPKFLSIAAEAIAEAGLDPVLRQSISPLILDYRSKLNAMSSAMTGWKTAKEQAEKDGMAGIESNAGIAAAGFDQIRASFVQGNQEAIQARLKHDEKLGYTAVIKPLIESAKAEIASSVKAGMPTAGMLRLIHDGVEYAYLSKTHEAVIGLLKSISAELQEAKARLAKIDEADPLKSSKSGGAAKDQGQKREGSSMMAGIRAALEKQ